MRGGTAKKCGSAAIQGEHPLSWLLLGITSLALAAVALGMSSRAHAGDGGSAASRRIVLSAEALDRVTAGSITLKIDADAAAHGATAIADAVSKFEVSYGRALMVHAAPPLDPHPMYVMGQQELAVTRGNGRAFASGDQGADCSVTVTLAISDLIAAMVNSIKEATATTVLCQCQLLAVSIAR
jgi:hypothetical protein